MTRAIAIVGSSVAIDEPWGNRFGLVDHLEADAPELTDQNFALTGSGHLWRVVASGTLTEGSVVTMEASRIARQTAKTRAAIELLRSWRGGDQAEQRGTLEFLKTALNENRIPGTKLFDPV